MLHKHHKENNITWKHHFKRGNTCCKKIIMDKKRRNYVLLLIQVGTAKPHTGDSTDHGNLVLLLIGRGSIRHYTIIAKLQTNFIYLGFRFDGKLGQELQTCHKQQHSTLVENLDYKQLIQRISNQTMVISLYSFFTTFNLYFTCTISFQFFFFFTLSQLTFI